MNFKTLIFLILVLFSSTFAQALSVKPLSLRQKVLVSDMVFMGTVTDIKRTLDPKDSFKRISTYTFTVEDCFKGNCDQKTVEIKQLAVGPGAVTYSINETYFLFLTKESEKTGLVAPVGFMQGSIPFTKKQGVWAPKKNYRQSGLIKDLQKESSVTFAKDPILALNLMPLYLSPTVDYSIFKETVKVIVEDQKNIKE